MRIKKKLFLCFYFQNTICKIGFIKKNSRKGSAKLIFLYCSKKYFHFYYVFLNCPHFKNIFFNFFLNPFPSTNLKRKTTILFRKTIKVVTISNKNSYKSVFACTNKLKKPRLFFCQCFDRVHKKFHCIFFAHCCICSYLVVFVCMCWYLFACVCILWYIVVFAL